jgi:hypothetical protein
MNLGLLTALMVALRSTPQVSRISVEAFVSDEELGAYVMEVRDRALFDAPPDTPAHVELRDSKPPTLVLEELGCYHFRVLDPRLPLR